MGFSDFKRLKSLNERKVLRGFTAEVRCYGMSRPPAYSFCGYLRSTSICCGHEILQHLEKQCDCQTVFNFFLSLIILHSKGFCSFHVLWQLNNNLYSTIKRNKNPDNINRYLSSLRRFASLKEILQIMRKHLDFRCPRLRQIRHRRHDSFYLQRPRKVQNCLRFAGSIQSLP